MQSPLQSPTAATDPKSVKVNITSGTGVDIEWNDGHTSHYSFVYLRDACPCAMCEEERGKSGRRPGDPVVTPPGALVIFKPAAKPLSAEGVGKYAIKFSWNDDHDLGIYSWKFLREVCPCEECKKSMRRGRAAREPGARLMRQRRRGSSWMLDPRSKSGIIPN